MNELSPKAAYSRRVQRLTEEGAKRPQIECPVRHLFAPGIYMREMTIPANTMIVGAMHKHDHYCIVSQGRIVVTTEDGDVEFTAGTTILSKAGAQRCGFAKEDTVWTTIHPNPDNIQDLHELVPTLVFAREDELLGGKDNVQLLGCGRSSGEDPCLLAISPPP